MRYRGPVWTKTETEALLSSIIKNNLLEKSATSGQLSHSLVKPLQSKGFERTAMQIRLKLRALRMSYQKCKKKGCTPNAMKECPYYSLLNKIYADQEELMVKQEPANESPEEPLNISDITNNTNIWIDQEVQTMLTIIDDMCLANDLSLNGFTNSALKLISNALQISGINRSVNQVRIALTSLKVAYVRSRESLEKGIETLTCPYYDYLDKIWGGEKISRDSATKKCQVERLPSIDDVIQSKDIHGRHHHAHGNEIDLKNGLEHEVNSFTLDDNNFTLDGNNYGLNDDNNYTLDHSNYNVDNNYLLNENYTVESIESIDDEDEEESDGDPAVVVDLSGDTDDNNVNNNVNNNDNPIQVNGDDKLSKCNGQVQETIDDTNEQAVENINNDIDTDANANVNTSNNNNNNNSNSNNNNVQTPGTLKRIVLWTHEEIMVMLKTIEELGLMTTRKLTITNANKLIGPLAEHGYTRTSSQIVSKIKNMRSSYLRCIGQGCTSDALKECPYFEALDKIYKQFNKSPGVVLDSGETSPKKNLHDDTNGFITDKESESCDHSYNSVTIDNDNDADRKLKKPDQDVLWSPVESIVENDVNMRIEDQFVQTNIEQNGVGMEQDEHEPREQQNYLDEGIMEHENIEIIDNCELNSSILNGIDPEVSLVQFVNKIDGGVTNDDEPIVTANIKTEKVQSDDEVDHSATTDITMSLNSDKMINPDIIMEHDSSANESVITRDRRSAATMNGNLKNTHDSFIELKPVQQSSIKTEVLVTNETSSSRGHSQTCSGNSLSSELMESVVQQILKHEEQLQEQHHRWMERQFEIQRQHDRSQRELLLNELREFRKTLGHSSSNNNFLSDH
ncbi:putative uncharacterized protein DDB_G0286901 [Microplitis mediator]|uniref:putative uncharacterized protein DDB_G0286901 n=1 Tax=Microplitis mediator TaxID=375433 RepID=UPI0025555A75|nr:putative uncharacterized protein DDB_G0286901 [Microplitis mediator]